jgi:formylglycine-generating enzyme required for sulfatase activity
LVTVSGGTATSRSAPLAQFPEGSPGRALVDAFLDPTARLLVVDGTQLRLAHEALLTHWPRARDQVASDARDLELRGRLEDEAKRWRDAPRRNKRDRVLPVGQRLDEGLALCARWGAALPAEVTAFVTASRRTARRNRRRRIASIAGAVVALPVVAALVWAGVAFWGVRTVEAEMEFVRIPPPGADSCFQMGSDRDTDPMSSPNEGPVRKVCPKPFELGKFEVTQRDWRLVMLPLLNPDPSRFKVGSADGVSWKDARWPAQFLSLFGRHKFKNDKLPIESVSWDDAMTFIRLMNFFGRDHYRLPSEAEWEYAARAGTKTAWYWGDRAEDGCDYENVAGCGSRPAATAVVGSYKRNPWGLYDILGNVAEWVEDCYVGNYEKAPKDGSAASIEDCTFRVVRGGSWISFPRILRAANRIDLTPGVRYGDIGFRLARTVAP